jgi:hypothetical protein
MRPLIFALAVGLLAASGAAPAAAQQQLPPGGYYTDGAYYAPATTPDTYWPTNNETAYDYGVYAVAPGFGPYLRLGGEGGWNPNIGSTYNSYPPGNYYTDYGFPYIAVPSLPYISRGYYGWGGANPLVCWPGYPFCR